LPAVFYITCLLKNDVIDIPIIVNEHNPAQIETLDDTQREGIEKRNAIMYFLSQNAF